MSVRVRFAPSPTGPLHIGGARSALFNWLFARRNGGKFIIRIEDTDLERSSRESEENILASLKWLGLVWDEGIRVGGDYGPYRQTERLDIYRQYAEKLVAGGHAYYCYCTEEELERQRKELLARGETPRYTGRCRDLSDEDRRRLENEGRRPVIRFKVPSGKVIKIDDLVRGTVSFNCSDIGDFIIMKSSKIPTYNFAVVVDDALMKISHVIRGEEHLSNTPRQVLMYDALGLPRPAFAHVSLILGKDRSKMSKRHGATSIEQYRLKGYLPEALNNFLVLLGWSPGGEEEVFTLDELKKRFSLDHVAKNPAVFDMEKLNWLNGYYIRNSSLERVTELALPYLKKAGYVDEEMARKDYGWLMQVVGLVRDYLSNLEEITDHVGIYFAGKIDYSDGEALQVLKGKNTLKVLEAVMEEISKAEEIKLEDVKPLLKKASKKSGVKGKSFFMTLRAALTGKTKGPELDRVIFILGKEKVNARLADALTISQL